MGKTFAAASADPNLHRKRELETDFPTSSQELREGKEPGSRPEQGVGSHSIEKGAILLERGMYLKQQNIS